MSVGRIGTAAGFWIATLLPLAYLPLFLLGIDSIARFSVLLALLALNALALVVGHGYPDTRTP